MLFCIKRVRINLFSNTIENKKLASTLFSLPGYSSLFTMFFENVPPLSPFCATAAAPGTWSKLKSYWTTHFIAERQGKKSTHRTFAFLHCEWSCLVWIVPLGIYCFDSKAKSHQILAFGVEKAFMLFYTFLLQHTKYRIYFLSIGIHGLNYFSL